MLQLLEVKHKFYRNFLYVHKCFQISFGTDSFLKHGVRLNYTLKVSIVGDRYFYFNKEFLQFKDMVICLPSLIIEIKRILK